MSNTAPRKRRNVEGPLASAAKHRGGANARRTARADRRAVVASNRRSSPRVVPPPPAETVDVMDNPSDDPAEVVDLTSEAWETAHVVDLTNNDSVLLVDEGSPARTRGRTRARTLTGRLSDPGGGDDGRRNPPGDSYVVSSDDDEPSSPLPAAALFSFQAGSSTRFTPGTISCPVCMDTYTEMVESGRLVVSTKCGHVFCSQCLRDALSRSHTCPTCRKRLTPRQYHPLYI